MRHDEGRIDLPRLDHREQRSHVALHVRLTHAHRQPFVHRRPEGDVVEQSHVHTGDRDRAALAAAANRFPQHVRAVRRQVYSCFHLVDDGVETARAVCFTSDGIDAAVGSSTRRHHHQAVVDVVLAEVDRFGAGRLGHAHALRHPVDRDDVPRAEHLRAAYRELTHGAASPHGHEVALFDAAVLGGHVSRREDVGQEQDLLVGQRTLDPDGADVRMRHAQVLGLTAGESAEHVREAEEARG